MVYADPHETRAEGSSRRVLRRIPRKPYLILIWESPSTAHFFNIPTNIVWFLFFFWRIENQMSISRIIQLELIGVNGLSTGTPRSKVLCGDYDSIELHETRAEGSSRRVLRRIPRKPYLILSIIQLELIGVNGLSTGTPRSKSNMACVVSCVRHVNRHLVINPPKKKKEPDYICRNIKKKMQSLKKLSCGGEVG
jgi:hypothetical protein